MAVTDDRVPATGGATFDSTSPASGELVGTFPVDGPERVAEAVSRARRAAAWWAGLGFDGRRRRLLAYKAFSRSKAITRQRFPLPFAMLSFDRPARLLPAVERAMKLRHARRPRG